MGSRRKPTPPPLAPLSSHPSVAGTGTRPGTARHRRRRARAPRSQSADPGVRGRQARCRPWEFPRPSVSFPGPCSTTQVVAGPVALGPSTTRSSSSLLLCGQSAGWARTRSAAPRRRASRRACQRTTALAHLEDRHGDRRPASSQLLGAVLDRRLEAHPQAPRRRRFREGVPSAPCGSIRQVNASTRPGRSEVIDTHRHVRSSIARPGLADRRSCDPALLRKSVESALTPGDLSLSPVGESENLGILPGGALAAMFEEHR
jgi:hypothetical protein